MPFMEESGRIHRVGSPSKKSAWREMAQTRDRGRSIVERDPTLLGYYGPM